MTSVDGVSASTKADKNGASNCRFSWKTAETVAFGSQASEVCGITLEAMVDVFFMGKKNAAGRQSEVAVRMTATETKALIQTLQAALVKAEAVVR